MSGQWDLAFDYCFFALLAGFILVSAIGYFAQMKVCLPPGRKVGPSYWGSMKAPQ